jgi:hypothetical protein
LAEPEVPSPWLSRVYDMLPGDIQADLPLKLIWSLADSEETE